MRKKLKNGVAAFLAMAMVVTLIKPVMGSSYSALAATETAYAQTNAVENDDGTFEGKKGNISLYTAHAISGAEGYGWSSDVTMNKIATEDGTKVQVTSTTKHSYDYLYVKFDTSIKAGNAYTIYMDMAALDEQSASGEYGYWILSPEAIATGENVSSFIRVFLRQLYSNRRLHLPLLRIRIMIISICFCGRVNPMLLITLHWITLVWFQRAVLI